MFCVVFLCPIVMINLKRGWPGGRGWDTGTGRTSSVSLLLGHYVIDGHRLRFCFVFFWFLCLHLRLGAEDQEASTYGVHSSGTPPACLSIKTTPTILFLHIFNSLMQLSSPVLLPPSLSLTVHYKWASLLQASSAVSAFVNFLVSTFDGYKIQAGKLFHCDGGIYKSK